MQMGGEKVELLKGSTGKISIIERRREMMRKTWMYAVPVKGE